MAVRLGVSFDGFSPLPDAVAIAKAAVEAGAASLWMAEHLGYRDSLTSCMAYALATPRATVVPTAVSPYLRNPMPLAMALATLAEAAPGRVNIAIGVGNPLFLEESGVTIDKPVRVIREYVEMLRSLWSGEPVRQDGMLYRLAGARMMFKPSVPIPIYLAPMKEQMLRLAGRIADGVVLSAGLSPEFARHSLSIAAAGAVEKGRDPASLRKAAYIYFLASDDTKRVRETLRQKLAFLMRNRFLDDNIGHSGIKIDQEAIIAAVAKRDMEAAAKLVPDEAIDRFAVGGTPRQCRDGLERYIEAGIEEPVLLMAGLPEDREAAFAVIREFNAA